MQAEEIAIVHGSERFSHSDACRIFAIAGGTRGGTVVIDLERVDEASTSAFARLVLLRRQLLKVGRDLRLINLRSKAASLFEVNRLAGVLPRGARQ